jgi:peptide/nickel transport system substrate-binding protein
VVGPTQDPRVRQAIAYAIDRETILEVIDGLGFPTLTRVIPPMMGVHPDLYGSYGTYDPERSRALLAEAGYAGEPIIVQSSSIFLLQREVTEVVGAMLEAVGFNVDLRIIDPTTFREQVYFTYRNDEIYFFATKNTFQDPWITMLGYLSDRGERVGWTGPEAEEVDRLARAAEVNMDLEERAAQYRPHPGADPGRERRAAGHALPDGRDDGSQPPSHVPARARRLALVRLGAAGLSPRR